MEKNKYWTIKVNSYGMEFYITDIKFEDIAIAAAKGIKTLPNTEVKVFYVKPT